MARKRAKRIYRYKCSITEREYKVTREVKNPENLLCLDAYYQMNPEEDDRPDSALATLGIDRDAPLEVESQETEDSPEEQV